MEDPKTTIFPGVPVSQKEIEEIKALDAESRHQECRRLILEGRMSINTARKINFETAIHKATPEDFAAIMASLERTDQSEPAGIARGYRDVVADKAIYNPLTMSCRSDQEALHDSNLIQHALRRAQAAEREIKRLRAIRTVCILMWPGFLFAGMWLTVITGAVLRLSTVSAIPFALGTLVAATAFGSLLTWTQACALMDKMLAFFGKGIFD